VDNKLVTFPARVNICVAPLQSFFINYSSTILALDSQLEELASEMKNFKLDLLDDLDRIFNQSTTTSTPANQNQALIKLSEINN